jgi:4-amino-4-deoxy-L-arabinose transferase-like glycosyltransferase
LTIIITFLVLGIIYDSVTPIFEASDEQSHYPYVKHLADGHGLPVQDPSDIREWRQEGSQPPLYYMLMALATFWIDTRDFETRHVVNPHAIVGIPAHHSNDNRNMLVHTAAENFPYRGATLAVHLIRWLSMLMGAGTVYAVYRLASRIIQRDDVALLAAALVAFNPMFVFISAAVNNDNLITLLATLSLWQLTRIWQDGLTYRRVVVFSSLVGMATLTKLSGIGLIGVAGLLILAKIWQEARKKKEERGRVFLLSSFFHELAFLLPILLIAGWWYARNVMLYGDVTGLNRMLEIVGTRQGTPALLPLLQAEAEGLWLSLWGLFGGVNILAASWVYIFFNGVTLFACVGIGIALWQARGHINMRPVTAFAWLALWFIVLLLAWMRWTLITPATQGRLLFPAIATLAITLAMGLVTLLDVSLSRVKEKFSCGLITLFVGVLCLIALRVALYDIAPAYTPAPLIAQAPLLAAREPIRFGDGLELVGVEPLGRVSLDTPLQAQAGDTIAVTLYWKVVAPMQKDYSFFVHLLDVGDLLIGQRDTYLGLGLRPTTQLSVGDIVRETYRIKINDTAIGPSQPEIRVGVYDFATGQRLPARRGAQMLGDNPTIGVLHLLATAPSSAPLPVAFNFEKYFALTGYQIENVVVRAGESFTLTLHWQVNSATPKDYSIFTHVLGKHDSLWGQVDRQQPMTTWTIGQRIADVYVIQVKPETQPEVYDLEIGAYDLNDNFKRLNVWGADGQFVGDRVLLRKIRVVK